MYVGVALTSKALHLRFEMLSSQAQHQRDREALRVCRRCVVSVQSIFVIGERQYSNISPHLRFL